MYVNNHNSELNDHWENIREAERYLTSVKHKTGRDAPEYNSSPVSLVVLLPNTAVRGNRFDL